MNARLFKKFDGAPAHAAAQDHVGFLLMDKARNLLQEMVIQRRVGGTLRVGHFAIFHIHQKKESGIPEVLGDQAVGPIFLTQPEEEQFLLA
jgi:hypothetical protein